MTSNEPRPPADGTPDDERGPFDVPRELQRHLPGLRAFLRARAGPGVRARLRNSDLVQAVCVEVLEHAPCASFANTAAFRGWLYTTAMRKLVDNKRWLTAEKRDMARDRPLGEQQGEEDASFVAFASELTPSMEVIGRERVRQIEAALDALPEAQREVLLLARMVGLTHAEIAAQTGRTETSCRQILRRALLKLGEELQRRGFDLGKG
ncbi:MAG: sigma-70 family RNA polymerase sigma factor [Planctomycetes bacterium]|nr:sigma-70 family RNA polymerase sigma factor [Planctomycetota bacterium]